MISISFRSSLPVVSNLTAMNLWDFVCMIFIYASMLEFIIVNYLYRKSHKTTYASRAQSSTADHHVDLRTNLAKDELEVRAPLVGGEDPSVIGSGLNHRNPARPITPTGQTSAQNAPAGLPRRPHSAMPGDDRARAAASVFAWLRRPNIFQPQQEMSSRAKLAHSIDHISKTVFPFLYGVFSFTFFAVFAGYLPSLLDEWIANEYRDE